MWCLSWFKKKKIYSKKYLLCDISGGGHADIFYKLIHYYKVAIKHQFILVIDVSLTNGYFDLFNTYFLPNNEHARKNILVARKKNIPESIFNDSDKGFQLFSIIANKTSDSEILIKKAKWVWCKNYYQVVLLNLFHHSEMVLNSPSLDFNYCSYRKHSAGCDDMSFLSNLCFAPQAAEQIVLRLNKLKPWNYLAIQIRNTDVRTNYKKYFKTIYKKTIKKKLLICSDDQDCVDFAKSYFKDSELLFTNSFVGRKNMPIHLWCNKNLSKQAPPMSKKRFDINIGVFTDIIALSLATEILTPIKRRDYDGTPIVSGFAQFAKSLARSPHIIKSLLPSLDLGSANR